MKHILILLFLTISTISAQHKFAWITDAHIGFTNADIELEKVVAQINSFDDIAFVLATGDITEKSRTSEFKRAKEILEKLEKPLLIIPGNHDTKWSNSGSTKFAELWNDDKFIYKKDNTVYIGMNSGIPLRGGGGHIKPEDIKWLKEQLSMIDSSKEIIFATHHPLNYDIDNWFMVTNLLRDHNIKALFHGHGHKTEKNIYNGIPAIMARSVLSKKQDSHGFLIVENLTDSLLFFEVEKDTIPKFWGKISKTDSLYIPYIDSTQFINYDAKLLFQKDIETTLVAPPLFWNEKIYVADYSGIVSCFNSNGELIWDYDTFGKITGKPSISDNKLIVATVQGELIILEALDGSQIATIGFDERFVAPPVIFDHKGVKNLIIPKETKSDAAIIIASTSGKIFCYDLETLQEIWISNVATDMIETAPLVMGNQIFFGSWDTHLYSIDANNGTTIWKWQGNKSFYFSPAVSKLVTDGKYLYFTTPDKMVYSVDLKQGTTRWKSKKFNAWESIGISENNKRLFIKSVKDKFHIISSRNGKLIKTININFGLDTMPVTPIEWNGKIIFSSKNGYVYKIDKKLRYKPILFLGTARVHSIQKIDDTRLMASNMDGKIIIFDILDD